MIDKKVIQAMALANGFKLKGQPDGSMDLNPYVYEFADAMSIASRNAWFDAVTDACTVAHIDWSENDPRATIDRLIDWHVQVALDPLVSEPVAKLHDTLNQVRKQRMAVSLELIKVKRDLEKARQDAEDADALMVLQGMELAAMRLNRNTFGKAMAVLARSPGAGISGHIIQAGQDVTIIHFGAVMKVDLVELLELMHPSAPTGKWVLVEEREPPAGKYVLIVRETGYRTIQHEIKTACLDRSYKGWTNAQNDRLTDSGSDPIAWFDGPLGMPLDLLEVSQ